MAGDRALLRPLEQRDVPVFAKAFEDDPELGPACGSEEDPDAAELAERVERASSLAAEGRGVELAIADRGSDDLLGSVTLHSIDWRNERGELGFWLARDARGRGVATEAVGLVVNWAFSDLGLYRVELITLPALPNFARVLALAKRLGFRQEGVMRERNLERGRRFDTMMLAVLRAE